MGFLRKGTRDERWGTGDSLRPVFHVQPTIFNFQFSVFFVLQFLFRSAGAQVATVTGSAPNFIGQEIRLVVQDDPISGEERTLSSTKVDGKGAFTLTGEVEPAQYGFLQVGRECGDLFLERGKSVTVRFAPPKRAKAPEGFNDRYFFRLDFIDGEAAKLNRDIVRYNDRLDAFLSSIYSLLKIRKNAGTVADSVAAFRKRVDVEFPGSDGFLSEYIRYSIANIEQTFILKRQLLYDRNLKGRPARPWNPEYMRFIGQFYEGVFERMALVDRREDCIAAMKKSSSFSEMEAILRQQPFMEDPFVRRAVMIRGMEKLYGQKGFEPERVTATLLGYSKSADSPVLAKAARNIAQRRERMRPGTAAPGFELTDTDGRTLRSDDFKGNYLMLEVTEAGNAYCLQEAAVLRDMQKRFPSIRFLTVLVDANEREVQEFKRDFAPMRPVAAIGRNDGFMADYAISSLPTFVIIGPEGRLYRSPALDPSKGGISELEAIGQTDVGKRKVGTK